jgi:hypothetical protein
MMIKYITVGTVGQLPDKVEMGFEGGKPPSNPVLPHRESPNWTKLPGSV